MRQGQLVLLFVAVIFGTYLVLVLTGVQAQFLNENFLIRTTEKLGLAGPLLIVALMTIAVVMSPLPSAPIALAAGAAYGHYWGTAYIAIGSLAGALTAFGISRYLGYEFVRSWLGSTPSPGLLTRFITSQNGLMAAVFVTRLLPFLSFDVISYAAGLTPLTIWRFVVATLLGIIPASFMLAHFGGQLASGDLTKVALTVLVLGIFTSLPLIWNVISTRYRSTIDHSMNRD